MKTLEANKALVTCYVEAFNRADFDLLRDIFSEDAQIHGVLTNGGLNQVIPIWRELHAAFGLKLQVEEMICEGDTVAVRYVERGAFTGSFRGHDPTGKPYELVAMEWFKIKGGKILKRWGARDSASQARQMGIPLA